MKKNILALMCALSPVVSAAITPLTNGNFETQSGSGISQDVDSWFESSSSSYDDWVNISPNAAAQFPAGQGNIQMMSTDSGYIYQNIGTRTSTDLGLRITGKAVLRYPGAPRSFKPFKISVYQTDVGVSGANGTHPSELTGAVLLSSKDVTNASLAFSATPTAAESRDFTTDLSLGTATNGKRLWIVFDAESGPHETGLDDLAITALSTDPGGAAGTPKIMLIGDSFWQNDDMRQSIYDGLTTAGEKFDFVGSEGRGTGPAGHTSSVTDPDHEGITSKQVIHAINGRLGPASRKNTKVQDLLTTYSPDIVALQLGTNDTWYNFQTAVAPYEENEGRSPAQLIADVRKLSRIIHTHNPFTRIIVTTVTPIISPNADIGVQADTFNANVLTYNALLATAVTDMQADGIHVTLNDNHGAWNGTATGNTGSDGLHPNAQGNQLAATTWVASIRQALIAFDGNVHYDTVQKIEASDSEARKIEKAAKLLPLKKQVDWQRLETTYFIHYGPNVFHGTNGREWGTGTEDPNVFAPTAYDANQWVSTIKNAGGKMVMLVVKHHEGFCLWQSRYTNHDLESTSWKNGMGNIAKDVSDACAAQGIKFGIYLSPADLYQIESSTNYTTGSGYYGHGSASKLSTIPTNPATFNSDPSQTRTLPAGFHSYQYTADDYNRYFLNQLYELLTEYGDIAEVWFDGANPKTGPQPQLYNRGDWYDLIAKLQPNALVAINGPHVRWVGNESGSPRPSEWSVIPIAESPTTMDWASHPYTPSDLGSRSKITAGSYLHWWPSEVDVPIRTHWFYNPSDSVRSSNDIIDLYYNSVGKNSNLLLNLSPDRRGLITDDQINPLMEAMTIINQTFANNLSAGSTIVADSTLAGFPVTNALDGNLDSHWEPAAGNSTPSVSLTFATATTIDRVVVQEAIAQRGMRIESFAIDTWNGASWQQQATATVVGHKRIVKIPETTTTGVRIRITQSRLEPALANIGVFKSASLLESPVISDRNNSGKVTITDTNGNSIYYTLDGSTPTTSSSLYTAPIDLPLGGTIKALSSDGSSVSLTVNKTFAGLLPTGWQVISVDSEESPAEDADRAIDDNPSTHWHTAQTGGGNHPHHITVDMQTSRWFGGFSYLPRNLGESGIVKTYRFEVSENNSTWINVAEGEFGNIKANPVLQRVTFTSLVKARYFRFTSLSEINGGDSASAAEINILPGGYDAFRIEHGLQTAPVTQDTDGDHLGLLMEYYLGTDPAAMNINPISIQSITASTLELKITRKTGVTDVSATIQYSHDLINWFDASPISTNSADQGNGTTIDTYTMASVDQKVFYRLKVSQ